jgi:hypothetical protein
MGAMVAFISSFFVSAGATFEGLGVNTVFICCYCCEKMT